jgi:hypothetical protein
MDMDYQEVTVLTVIKRFLLGWTIAIALLVVVSCVKFKEFIVTAFLNNTWAWVNAVIPIVVMVFVIGYVIRSLFRYL